MGNAWGEIEMSKRPYTKEALPFSEQAALLRKRGMQIRDEAEAAFYLSHLNYYRLTAYWLPFEEDHSLHRFRAGTTFEQVLNLYVFDRELRLLMLDALERIEVSVRTQWAHYIGLNHGSHGHLDPSLARNEDYWLQNKNKLKTEILRAEKKIKEQFIIHLMQTYEEALPPIWACSEVMSLGLLSLWYANLQPMKTRQNIASTYELDEALFQSWLHHLTIVRNICAHHGRLWNRRFPIPATKPDAHPEFIRTVFSESAWNIHNTFLIVLYLLSKISPESHWLERLIHLIDKHNVPVDQMGFPEGWRAQSIWKGVIL